MGRADKTGLLDRLLVDTATLRQVDDYIFSVLHAGESERRYDLESRFYDALVGNRLYLRIVWDNRPEHFSRFVEQAVRSSGDGPYLDAGCGSLLFSARVYGHHLHRPVVLVDKSLGMLRKARMNLERTAGQVPDNVVLLQADGPRWFP